MSHTKILLILRDPVDRAFSEYKNKRDLMVKGAQKATFWVNGHAKFAAFAASLKAATSGCTPSDLYAACKPCMRFLREIESEQTIVVDRRAPPNATDEGRCEVPPVVWQSWYHIFLPRYLLLGHRVLLEFFDDMSADAASMMTRVGEFLALPSFNYSTSVAYNTEHRRGAYINVASASSGRDGVTVSTATGSSTASSVGNNAAKAPPQQKSVQWRQRQTRCTAWAAGPPAQLVEACNPRWAPPSQQFRRSLTPQWRERYDHIHKQ